MLAPRRPELYPSAMAMAGGGEAWGEEGDLEMGSRERVGGFEGARDAREALSGGGGAERARELLELAWAWAPHVPEVIGC